MGAASKACRFRSLDLQRRRRRRFGVRPASSRLRLPAAMVEAMLRHSQDPIFGRLQPSLCLFCPACCRVEAAETRELKEQSVKSAPKTPNPTWRLEFVPRFATSVTRCAGSGKCHQRTRRSLSGCEHVSSKLHSRCLLQAFNLLLPTRATQLVRCLQQSRRVEVLVVMSAIWMLDEDDVALVISAVGSSHGMEPATYM